jgi:hypothetical protein
VGPPKGRLREGTDGKEEARRRRDPARAVLAERAAGDEDRRAAEIAPEMARIEGEGGERGGDGAEEQRVEHAGMALGEGVQGVRQRKHDAEVLHGQQLGAAGDAPAFFCERLALRVVPVAARIVGEAFRPARITRLPMAAERGGATRLDGLCPRSPNNPHLWSLKSPHPPHEGGHRHDGDIVDGPDVGQR